MNVITPQIIENLTRTLARASAERLRVSPRGGNSTSERFLPPTDFDLGIDLTRLNRVIAYEPANLTITVEAGMTLAALQNVLREHGQFLPLDPPYAERATLGGIIASNASGPLRMRYGTMRDWLIGVTVVMADGRVVRGGGKVVKNVAGYDLPKLFIGSLGTLGVIAETTFKLSPLPPFSRTLVAQFATHTAAVNVLLPMLRATFVPNALEILDPAAAQTLPQVPNLREDSHLLVAQFAGNVAAVERQAREFETLCQQQHATQLTTIEGQDADALWQRVCDLTTMLGRNDATISEMRLLPSQLDEAMMQMRTLTSEANVACALLARAGRSLWSALIGDDAAVCKVTTKARTWISERKGYLIIQRTPSALKGQLDVWGVQSTTRADFAVMQALKTQFDPQNILNPGEFIGGL